MRSALDKPLQTQFSTFAKNWPYFSLFVFKFQKLPLKSTQLECKKPPPLKFKFETLKNARSCDAACIRSYINFCVRRAAQRVKLKRKNISFLVPWALKGFFNFHCNNFQNLVYRPKLKTFVICEPRRRKRNIMSE